MFEEDDTLASESASEEDDDSAGLERWPRFSRMKRLASLRRVHMVRLWVRALWISQGTSLREAHRLIKRAHNSACTTMATSWEQEDSHLSGLTLIFCRIPFAGFLRLVRYCPLLFPEFLRLRSVLGIRLDSGRHCDTRRECREQNKTESEDKVRILRLILFCLCD